MRISKSPKARRRSLSSRNESIGRLPGLWDSGSASIVGAFRKDLYNNVVKVWNDAYNFGECVARNAQTTVIAPTGTIGFMMDCDTTCIEAGLALVKYKMVGGGVIKIVNHTGRRTASASSITRATCA